MARMTDSQFATCVDHAIIDLQDKLDEISTLVHSRRIHDAEDLAETLEIDAESISAMITGRRASSTEVSQ